MSIILFAIIGSSIDAGPMYWICYGIYSVFKATRAIVEFIKVST